MNVKKLAVIGVIALVVFGCVVAAGCTSSTQTIQNPDGSVTTKTSSSFSIGTSSTTVDDNKMVGTWRATISPENAKIIEDKINSLGSTLKEDLQKLGVTTLADTYCDIIIGDDKTLDRVNFVSKDNVSLYYTLSEPGVVKKVGDNQYTIGSVSASDSYPITINNNSFEYPVFGAKLIFIKR